MSATPIRFGKGAEYFAVTRSDFSSDRSMLLLYGEDGQIVYQEILGESILGVAALPTKNGERLLVGCTAKIFEYSPMLSAPTAPKPRVRLKATDPVQGATFGAVE
jgi:hypothetical protein